MSNNSCKEETLNVGRWTTVHVYTGFIIANSHRNRTVHLRNCWCWTKTCKLYSRVFWTNVNCQTNVKQRGEKWNAFADIHVVWMRQWFWKWLWFQIIRKMTSIWNRFGNCDCDLNRFKNDFTQLCGQPARTFETFSGHFALSGLYLGFVSVFFQSWPPAAEYRVVYELS